MIRLMEEGYGKDKSIPQLILAGASVDDVFVIVVFTALTTLASTGKMSVSSFIQIPVSIILGVMLGCVVGIILVWFFKKWHMRDSVKVLIIISISFLLLEVQNRLEGVVPVSGLLAIMSMGIIINQKYDVLAKRLSVKYNKMWLGAEVFLPPLKLCGDNAAMIGAQGYYEYLAGNTAGMELNAYATKSILGETL